MAVTFPSGISNDTPSSVFFKAWGSYLKSMSSILIDFSALNDFAWFSLHSSFLPSWISLIRSREIFTSCKEYMNDINCSTGELSCPTIYWIASIAPKVIWPFITAVAAKTVISMFLTSLMNMDPASCVCCSFNDFIWTLNKSACTSSHSHRLRCSQSCSFISCIDVINWYVLFWLIACCSNIS